MSTILKALRRVEQERPATPAPPRRAMRGDIVADAGGRPPPRKKRGGPNLTLWGSLAAVALLAALVWWRLPRAEGDEIAESQPQARVQPAEPSAEAPPAPASPAAAPRSPAERLAARTASTPEAPPPVAPQSDVPAELAEHLPPLGEALEVPTPAAAPPIAAVAPAPEPAAAPAPTPQASVAVAIQEPSPAPAPPVAEPVADAKPSSPPRPAAKPAPVIAKPAAPPTPAMPAVWVERTSWHPTPERRVAWVRVEGLAEARELHQGDGVGVFVVEEIRPSAVVFQHGSDTLERRVGER